MPLLRFTCGLFFAILSVVAVVAADEPESASGGASDLATTSDSLPQRVIVVVNRNTVVHGTLELEDDAVIVIRNLKGELESFPDARVLELIHLVDPQPGQSGIVVLRNGQFREGVIIEDSYDQVVLEIEGIRARLFRDVVHHVVLEPSFEERYETYRTVIGRDMHRERLELCRWLVREHEYELARRDLEALLDDKEIPQARQLLNVVVAQLTLDEKPTTDPGAHPAAPASGAAPRSTGPVLEKDLLPTQLISREDVNLMRVYEIDFEDPPKVMVRPETIRRMVETYGTNKLIPRAHIDRLALFRADPLDIVRLIFELRARELYDEVEVLTEPRSMNLFRQRVHNAWLMNNCATSRCHGGIRAGRLFLHHRRHKDARVRYTNLLILERLKLHEEWPLINYSDPEMSLIIQYAMNREHARLPHPEVKGWRPVFRHGADRRKAHAVEWIRSMMQPRPAYPVEFEPPQIGASPPSGGGDAAGGDVPR